jgi:hypothetical protein
MNYLFAIDAQTDEIIVSSSAKGSFKIDFIERIARDQNISLYYAVQTLSSLAKSPNLDTKIFKSMDKVCQMIYTKHKQTS